MQVHELFIKILRSELTGTDCARCELNKLDASEFKELYLLSKKHDLAHIVSSYISRSQSVIDKGIAESFSKQEMLSVLRHRQMKYDYEKIISILSSSSISYIPLKGSVIRAFYPKESMRTSCDIDILIHEEDIERAVLLICESGFTAGERGYHDVSLYSRAGTHLELHFSILETIDSLDSVLCRAWEYSIPAQNSRFDFTPEFFLFHIISHASYHFIEGGTGVRTLMDIFLIEKNMGISVNDAKALFEEAGIYKFAEEIEQLANVCFGNKESTELSDEILTYILVGGVYGNNRNRSAMKKGKQSTFKHAVLRLLPPFNIMSEIYPKLKKCPILLPYYWVKRLLLKIFKGKLKDGYRELRDYRDVSTEQVDEFSQFKQKLGL